MSVADRADEPGADPGGAGVAERIRRSLGDLSRSERKVARALLSGPPTIGLESLAELARGAGVSGPTVSRFVARLGFPNYAAFQRTLRDDLSARVLSPVEVFRSHREHAGSPHERAAAEMADAVARTLTRLNPAELDRAVALCADPRRRLLVAGGWSSHLLAAILCSLLRPFRPGVAAVSPVPAERTSALTDLARRDVVVVFDFRRYEQDTYDFARQAKERSASCVLITDPWLSPVADLADAVLPAHVDGPTPFESLTPTLALVETLTTAVAARLGAGGDDHLGRYSALADRWVRPYGGEPAP